MMIYNENRMNFYLWKTWRVHLKTKDKEDNMAKYQQFHLEEKYDNYR